MQWQDIETATEDAAKAAKDNSAPKRKAQGDILLKAVECLQTTIEGLPDLSESGAALKKKMKAAVDGGLVSLLEHAASAFRIGDPETSAQSANRA